MFNQIFNYVWNNTTVLEKVAIGITVGFMVLVLAHIGL